MNLLTSADYASTQGPVFFCESRRKGLIALILIFTSAPAVLILLAAIVSASFRVISPSVSHSILLYGFVVYLVLAICYGLAHCCDKSFQLGAIAISILLLCIAAMHAAIPMSSWDGLGWWGSSARTIAATWSGNDVQGFYYRIPERRHPLTLSILLAFSQSSFSSASFLYSLTMISGCVLSGVGTWIVSNSKFMGVMLFFVLLSLPLLENHSILFGYAEIFIWYSLNLFFVVFLLCKELVHRNYFIYIVFCVLGSLPLFLKNIGGMFSLGVLAFCWGYALPAAGMSLKRKISFIFVLLVAFPLMFFVGGGGIGFIGDQLFVEFGGWKRNVIFASTFDVVYSWIAALVINSSFSTSVLALLLWITLSLRSKDAQWRLSRSFLLFAIVTFSLFLLPSFIDSYFVGYVRSGYDTGFSRFIMPAVGCFWLPLSIMYRKGAEGVDRSVDIEPVVDRPLSS